MYHILDRSIERVGDHISASQNVIPNQGISANAVIVLQMQQNRSSFPQEGRAALCVLVSLFMLTSVLPALRGNFLVPLFSISVMALLVWALEFHQNTAPYSERLELADGKLRYTDSAGRTFAMPSYWARFETEKRTPVDVRLHLRSRDKRFEFGNSLSLEERLAIAPVIERTLATARGH
jgi:uncharacterized membrane protein